jgi:peptidoglycan/LPS O-acetylase OafA/YrhL
VLSASIAAPSGRSDISLPVHSGGPVGSERFYRPELDVLRFFAFLSVFFHHGLPGFDESHHRGTSLLLVRAVAIMQSAGAFGVCLFFTLSAYLITELLRREEARTGMLRVKFFYVRRILRIWPLYFSFLLVAFGIGKIVPSLYVEGARILAFVFLAGNWYVSAVGCGASSIGPLWSISLEEQFYLVWPWLAKLGGTRRLLVISVALFPVAWLAIAVLSRMGRDADVTIWVNSLVQFQFFGLGALIAIILNGRTPNLDTRSRVTLVGVSSVLWLLAAGIFRIKADNPTPSPMALILGYTFVVVGCLCLLLASLGTARRFPPALIFLGKISYGLYVFHRLAQVCTWKLIVSRGVVLGSLNLAHKVGQMLLVQVLALGATLALAYFSYRLFETRFLHLKDRFAVVRSRAV